jgi:hypothetical protein
MMVPVPDSDQLEIVSDGPSNAAWAWSAAAGSLGQGWAPADSDCSAETKAARAMAASLHYSVMMPAV